MTREELFKKYSIVYIDGCRYYLIDLKTKSYNFENTTPYCITIDGVTIYDSSWKNMIPKVVEELDSKNPKTIDQLLSINAEWGKQCVFGNFKKTNYVEYRGIYINTNHTALHAMWTIQLLLNEYNVNLDNCSFVLKRQPAAEPNEVRDFFKNEIIIGFKNHLRKIGKNEKTIEIILKNIDILNTKALSKLSNGYTNFFLIEAPQTFLNYYKKVIDYAPKLGYPKNTIVGLDRQLNYLYEYIREVYSLNKIKYTNYVPIKEESDELSKFLDDFDSFS